MTCQTGAGERLGASILLLWPAALGIFQRLPRCLCSTLHLPTSVTLPTDLRGPIIGRDGQQWQHACRLTTDGQITGFPGGREYSRERRVGRAFIWTFVSPEPSVLRRATYVHIDRSSSTHLRCSATCGGPAYGNHSADTADSCPSLFSALIECKFGAQHASVQDGTPNDSCRSGARVISGPEGNLRREVQWRSR